MKKTLISMLLATVLSVALLSSVVCAENSAWFELQQAVQNGDTVTLTKDVVCDNQDYGPITIPQGVTVTIDLNGYTIDRNLTEAFEKGAVLDVYGSLTVKDSSSGKTGTITGGFNSGSDNLMVAGGIQVSGGALVLESGNITGCSSKQRGAGVNIQSGSFLMKGGSIRGNQALSHGAGVSVTSGTFTMTGGTISGNQANVGAGVCASLADLILSGGEISGNIARESAGGLNTFGNSNITLNGCKITGNTAPKSGGAAFFLQDGKNYTFKVGKDTVISGNTDTNGNPSNLFLNSISKITFITIMDGEDAPDGMNIGISSKNSPTSSEPVQISTATMRNAYRGCFFSDNPEFWTDIKDGILYLTTEPPTCSVTYTGSDKVTFSAVTGDLVTSAKAGDPVSFKFTVNPGYTPGTFSVKTAGGTPVTVFVSGDVYSFTMPADDAIVTVGLTIDAPTAVTGLIYDGSTKTGAKEGEGYTLTANTAVNAGSYIATATLKEGYIWSDGSLEDKKIEWTIVKANTTSSLFTFSPPDNLIADGKPKQASIIFNTDDGKLTGIGSITLKYQRLGESGWGASTTEAPTEPGTYRVLVNISEGDNLSSVSELTMDSWIYTIADNPAPVAYTIIEGANSTWAKSSTNGLLIRSDAPFEKFDSVKVDGTTIAAVNYTAADGSTKITLAPAYLESLSAGSHSIEIVSKDGSASTVFSVKPAPATYAVTFNMCDHGNQVESQIIKEGEKAIMPTNPLADGYTFDGWYADATFSAKFDFGSTITADTTVYAKWTKNSGTSTDSPIPQTGDSSNMLLLVLLLAASGAALTGTAICSKKRKRC